MDTLKKIDSGVNKNRLALDHGVYKSIACDSKREHTNESNNNIGELANLLNFRAKFVQQFFVKPKIQASLTSYFKWKLTNSLIVAQTCR